MGQRVHAVHGGLALAQQVQVGAVEDKNGFHGHALRGHAPAPSSPHISQAQTETPPPPTRPSPSPTTCHFFWLREEDLNLRPLGYEPNELPDCSIARQGWIVAWFAFYCSALAELFSSVATPGRSTNSTKAMGALSPTRKPIFRIRVWPPGRSRKWGPRTLNNLVTLARSRRRLKARRRLATESCLASVIMGSITRRNSLALGRVVLMTSCSMSEFIMFCSIARRCELVRLSLRRPCPWRMVLSFYCIDRAAVSGTARGTGLNLTFVQASGWPVFELHARREATRGKHFLDLIERLAAQVGRLEQFVFGALYQVTDVVDVFGLQAVGRAHGQFQFVDRAQQDRIEAGIAAWPGRCVERSQLATFELCEHRQLFHQDLGRCPHCVFGRDGAIGFDLDDQLV